MTRGDFAIPPTGEFSTRFSHLLEFPCCRLERRDREIRPLTFPRFLARREGVGHSRVSKAGEAVLDVRAQLVIALLRAFHRPFDPGDVARFFSAQHLSDVLGTLL